jgi:glycosyltransferase involved in cell wall biosynthesis
MKKRLSLENIPFKHFYFKNYLNIVNFYNAIDLYIITSRAEGGPKALIESFASGVPVVSTDVGMVHDIAKHEYNAMITKIDDLEDLVYNCEKVIGDSSLRRGIISRGLETVKDYDWKIITEKYYKEIYFNYL